MVEMLRRKLVRDVEQFIDGLLLVSHDYELRSFCVHYLHQVSLGRFCSRFVPIYREYLRHEGIIFLLCLEFINLREFIPSLWRFF